VGASCSERAPVRKRAGLPIARKRIGRKRIARKRIARKRIGPVRAGLGARRSAGQPDRRSACPQWIVA
jgi:hypothetical protein